MKKSNGKNMLLKNIAQLYEVQKVIHKLTKKKKKSYTQIDAKYTLF